MRTGIVTKLVGTLLRVVVLSPALMILGAAIESVYRPSLWITPMSRFWYLPLFSGLFALLCILPYPDILFKRAVKPLVLGVILLVCAFKLRHEFLPFHYAAPELANHPAYVAEFEAAKKEPNGLGFSSERKEGGRLLWIVNKANYTPQNIVIMGSFCLVPLILFLLRNHEVCRGITWRNFTLPPQKVTAK
ncbi:MAG: hypothetical protein M9920_12450 [Verrucomicrobiae bacterium]|nr:hypothetical protein [Verrucomicrobiae bacterium]